MGTYDARTGEVLVFTFKDGPLSTVAHDLKLKVEKFSIAAQGASFTADFDAGSFKVVGAMKDGKDHPDGLGPGLYPDVLRNLNNAVLLPAKYPGIRFVSTKVTDTEVVGQLTLMGVTKELKGTRSSQGGKRVAEFKVDQRDFGITPYSAMLGAIRLRPHVVVRVTLPL
jgi:hypothetical protein